MIFYRIAKVILPIVLFFLRIEVEGKEELPADGPVILAANHKSFWDPVVLGLGLPRPIRFMAKAELFRIPGFSLLIRLLGAFPVHRETADRAALREALAALKKGQVLGIFVEGTRIRRAGIGELRKGVYLLARMSKAPVVLAGISGTYPFRRRIKIRLKRFAEEPGSLEVGEYLATMKKELEELIA